MWAKIKDFFTPPKDVMDDYTQLLKREADPNFEPPVRLRLNADGSFTRIPYIKQPKPIR